MLVNPKNNEEVTTPKEIKGVTLNYCVDILTNREPTEEFKDLMNEKERLHS